MKSKQNITLGSLFDGIGGFPYAGSFYGIESVWASEILPQAVSVTMRHFPGMEHVGDITELDGAKLPPVDIITFGSPCQDLSTAGRRAGLMGERSGLFMEAIRIIDEMRRATNGKYPRYALWENVPGAMSSGKPAGSDFSAVLEAFTKAEIPMPPSGRWAYAGMVRGRGVDLAWRILDAQHFGVPQRRRRVFLICDFGGTSAGEILFIEKGLRGNFAKGTETRQGTPAHAQGSAGVTDKGSVTAFAANQRDEVRDLHNVSAAVCAQPGMKQQTFIAENCLNPWDAQQTRVFTEDGTSPTLAGADGGGGRNPGGLVFAAFLGGASAKARSIGYSENVSPTLKGEPCGFSSPCICEPELARTLTARGDSSPCADRGQNVVAVGVSQNQHGDVNTSNVAYPLTTNSNASGRSAPLVAHPEISGTLCASGAGLSRPAGMANEPIPIHDKATRHKNGGAGNGLGIGKTGDPAPTLTSGDHHAAAIPINTQTAVRCNAMGEGTGFGVGNDNDPAYTLQQAHCHAVAAVFNRQRSDLFKKQDIASTQSARQHKDATDLVMDVSAVDCRNYKEVGDVSGTLQAKDKPGYSLNYQNPVRAGYIVRRLTPTECERLQGYPDGWTLYSADGKEVSDTRRYQMLGNSVCVNVVAFIMSGIAAQIYFSEKEAA